MGFGIRKLKRAIKEVEEWAIKNKMTINRKKSGIIFHKKRASTEKKKTELYKQFPIVRKYQYLGIMIDETMRFKFQLEHMEEKIKKGMKIVNIMKWKKMPI